MRQQRRLAAVHVEADLGQVPHVLADPNQLEQVFLNICLNACQAMGAAGGPAHRPVPAQSRGG